MSSTVRSLSLQLTCSCLASDHAEPWRAKRLCAPKHRQAPTGGGPDFRLWPRDACLVRRDLGIASDPLVSPPCPRTRIAASVRRVYNTINPKPPIALRRRPFISITHHRYFARYLLLSLLLLALVVVQWWFFRSHVSSERPFAEMGVIPHDAGQRPPGRYDGDVDSSHPVPEVHVAGSTGIASSALANALGGYGIVCPIDPVVPLLLPARTFRT